MAPTRPRQGLSEKSKAILDKISAHSSDNAQTPSRNTPGVPNRCRKGGLKQQQLNLKVNKALGHVSTSSDSGGYLFRPLANPFQQKQSANAPEAFKNGEPSGQQGCGHPAPRVDEQSAAKARPAEQTKSSVSAGSSKQPSATTPVINGNGGRQVKERRGINVLDESQGADHETPKAQKISLREHNDDRWRMPNSNLGREQEGQGGETDGYHVSPSSQGSRTLELRIQQRQQGTKTPLKTYFQSRTIAATQGGRIAVGEQAAEEDNDDQDSQ